MEYGDILLVSVKLSLRKRLQTLQNKALKCTLGLDPLTNTAEVHAKAKLDTLQDRRKQHIAQLMFKQRDNPTLRERKGRRRLGVATRSSMKKQFKLCRIKTKRLKNSITDKAPRLWNKLPKEVQDIRELGLFKSRFKAYMKQNKLARDLENEEREREGREETVGGGGRGDEGGGGGGGDGGGGGN